MFEYNEKLPQKLEDIIFKEFDEVKKMLSINENDSIKSIVEKIKIFVDVGLSMEKHSDKEIQNMTISLGCAWAVCVVKAYGWNFRYLGSTPKDAGIYIVSPDERYCCPPLNFINKILTGKNIGTNGKNDNTILLLFNILSQDNINLGKYEKDKYNVLS